MGKTGISWTDEVWNCVRGCSRVSEGCTRCYAEAQAARIVRMGKGKPTAYDGLVRVTAGGEPRWTGDVRLVPEQLAWPLRKRKPLRIFVNSMSDLFHERLTNEQIAAVFGVMAACPQHTFQVLTKRAKRMREWFEWAASPGWTVGERLMDALPDGLLDGHARSAVAIQVNGSMAGWHTEPRWPLPNVWLGVSVENQDAAAERIPELLRTPAAVRFLSCEPLLGEVDLAKASQNARSLVEDLDWVIAGCESGPGARPCSVEWLRSLRDQCASAGVAYFLKQATELRDDGPDEDPREVGYPSSYERPATVLVGDGSRRKPGSVIELPYLDGVQHAAFPEPQ